MIIMLLLSAKGYQSGNFLTYGKIVIFFSPSTIYFVYLGDINQECSLAFPLTPVE